MEELHLKKKKKRFPFLKFRFWSALVQARSLSNSNITHFD